MSRSVRLCLAAALTVALAGLVPGGALAATEPPTINAQGIGQAKPTPADPKSEDSIQKAVDEAQDKALPIAVREAQEYAAKVAAAAGLKLGPLVSISSSPFGPYISFGTFGNGNFCGKVRNSTTAKDKNGRRHRKLLPGTHTVCRVPGSVSVSVSVTYAVAP
jgi:hypothetical protein